MMNLALIAALIVPADVPPEPAVRVTVARNPYAVVCERVKTLKIGMTLKEVDRHVGVRPNAWDWPGASRPAFVYWVDVSGDGPRAVVVEFRNGTFTRVISYPPPTDPVRRAEFRKRWENMARWGRGMEWPPAGP